MKVRSYEALYSLNNGVDVHLDTLVRNRMYYDKSSNSQLILTKIYIDMLTETI